MGNRRTAIRLIWAAALACVPLAAVAGGCAPDQLAVTTATGQTASFRVEVADDVGERARGLMFRDHMASSAGMLFVFAQPEHARFWMKNTLIPLDMVFADAGGRVTVVHENAVPQDLTPIDGGTGVQFVLEINGGLARGLGITPGAVISHAAVDAAGQAVKPCG